MRITLSHQFEGFNGLVWSPQTTRPQALVCVSYGVSTLNNWSTKV